MCYQYRPVVYCHADDANLCRTCDSVVHSANPLVMKHRRSWLCEVCAIGVAVVRCVEDASLLCKSCDEKMHPSNDHIRSKHKRVPVQSYVGSVYQDVIQKVSTSANVEEVDQYSKKYTQVKSIIQQQPNDGDASRLSDLRETADSAPIQLAVVTKGHVMDETDGNTPHSVITGPESPTPFEKYTSYFDGCLSAEDIDAVVWATG